MNNIKIFVDGAYSSLRDQGGIGIIFCKNGSEIQSFKKMYKHVTNNKMELLAVIISLQTVIKNNLGPDITIVSDSQYVIGCATKGWKRNKNVKLWKRYDELISKLDKMNIKVHFEWVKGHNNDPFNEKADKLAVEASQEIEL